MSALGKRRKSDRPTPLDPSSLMVDPGSIEPSLKSPVKRRREVLPSPSMAGAISVSVPAPTVTVVTTASAPIMTSSSPGGNGTLLLGPIPTGNGQNTPGPSPSSSSAQASPSPSRSSNSQQPSPLATNPPQPPTAKNNIVAPLNIVSPGPGTARPVDSPRPVQGAAFNELEKRADQSTIVRLLVQQIEKEMQVEVDRLKQEHQHELARYASQVESHAVLLQKKREEWAVSCASKEYVINDLQHDIMNAISNESDAREQVKQLTQELQREKEENARLRRMNAELRREVGGAKAHGEDKPNGERAQTTKQKNGPIEPMVVVVCDDADETAENSETSPCSAPMAPPAAPQHKDAVLVKEESRSDTKVAAEKKPPV